MAILSRFCALRLADTVTAATLSYPLIKTMALVLWCIRKTELGNCGDVHFSADLYPYLGKNLKFCIICDLRLADTVTSAKRFYR